mmetsp:Transcript_10267/g.28813  ORF Transcript_10267/g.28813 Transcript_10267/m.28813 type:complete len:755 (+) Transcript_10267:290-2554(+)
MLELAPLGLLLTFDSLRTFDLTAMANNVDSISDSSLLDDLFATSVRSLFHRTGNVLDLLLVQGLKGRHLLQDLHQTLPLALFRQHLSEGVAVQTPQLAVRLRDNRCCTGSGVHECKFAEAGMGMCLPRPNVNVHDVAAGPVLVLFSLRNDADLELAVIDNVEPIANAPLLDDPISLLHRYGLHNLEDHLLLRIGDILEHHRRPDGLGDTGLLRLGLFGVQCCNVKVFVLYVRHVPLGNHAPSHLLNGLGLLFGNVMTHWAVTLSGQHLIVCVITFLRRQIFLRCHHSLLVQYSGRHALVHLRSLRVDRFDEHADHGDVIGTELVLEPKLVALGNDSAAGGERVVEFAAQINDGLVGQELEHAIRRKDDDLVVGAQLSGDHLRLGADAKLLGDGIAQTAGEGRAGILAVGAPNAGRVATLVDLLTEDEIALTVRSVVLILVGDGLEALDLVEGQNARTGLADADPLILAVWSLIAGEGQGTERPVDGGIGRVDRAAVRPTTAGLVRRQPLDALADNGTGIAHVAHGDAIAAALDVGRDGGGSGEGVVQGGTAVHGAVGLDVGLEGAGLRLILGQLDGMGVAGWPPIGGIGPGLRLPVLGLANVLRNETREGVPGELSALVSVPTVAIINTEEGIRLLSRKVFGNGKGILIGLVGIVGIITSLREEGVADPDPAERGGAGGLTALDAVLDLGVGHGLVLAAPAGSVGCGLGDTPGRLGGSGGSAAHFRMTGGGVLVRLWFRMRGQITADCKGGRGG